MNVEPGSVIGNTGVVRGGARVVAAVGRDHSVNGQQRDPSPDLLGGKVDVGRVPGRDRASVERPPNGERQVARRDHALNRRPLALRQRRLAERERLDHRWCLSIDSKYQINFKKSRFNGG